MKKDIEKKTLLVIGATGLVGTHVVRAAASKPGEYTVVRGSRTPAAEAGDVAIDIANPSSVTRAFQEIKPDVVMLLAAIADIDLCEKRPDYAFNINARGAENVGKASVEAHARLLFTSTAAVFDGKKHGYEEADDVSPLSVYGETKVWAEQKLASLAPSTLILRLALILGFAHRPQTNSLLDKTTQRWKDGKPAFFPTYESRNPIDALSLAELLLRMLKDDVPGGIYHAGASESVSRFELGKLIAARAGVGSDLVRPVDSPIPGRAPRGNDHFLLTEKLNQTCHIESPSIAQVIERCFE